MSEPFLSEIKLVSFNFPPKGWALCNGQFLPINQNQALFALLGTTYGGNGQTTFALPNLRGRVPIHMGNGHTLGEAAGSTSVTVNIQQLPTHIHTLNARNDVVDPNANNQDPTGRFLAGAQVALQGGNKAPAQTYTPPANLVALNSATCSNVGGSQPHNNMMPYLVLNFIIALQGIFPSQN
jgi:microcystin-dependent protein